MKCKVQNAKCKIKCEFSDCGGKLTLPIHSSFLPVTFCKVSHRDYLPIAMQNEPSSTAPCG